MWNKNEREGKTEQVKGQAKQVVADVTGDEDLRAEGEADEIAGTTQSTIGKVQKKVGEAIEDVGKAVKR
jgi:uncharacterized protein YjbJ (UPF0337 family)